MHLLRKKATLVILITFVLLLIFLNISTNLNENIQSWQWSGGNTESGKYAPFILTKGPKGEETYILSAIAFKEHESLNIIVTSMDATNGNGAFECCLMLTNGSLLTTTARFHHKYSHADVLPFIEERFNPAYFYAVQYKCTVSADTYTSLVDKLSLSATTCSHNIKEYLPIIHQRRMDSGLAICAKTAFGDKLKPSRLVEWFEMQKILGVDKIFVFDLECPEDIKRVFRYYVNEGILEVQPYRLPGEVPGHQKRSLILEERVVPQFSHDESLSILDCHQRFGGYQYILASDFDEIIIPHNHLTLKELLKDLTSQDPTASGFFFHVQFHLHTWGRYRNNTDTYFQQYLTSTPPRWECQKYIYMPSRVHYTSTHDFSSHFRYHKHYVKPDVATIHHYRDCPHGWSSCYPKTIVDDHILKYEKIHTPNTQRVLEKINIKSSDHA